MPPVWGNYEGSLCKHPHLNLGVHNFKKNKTKTDALASEDVGKHRNIEGEKVMCACWREAETGRGKKESVHDI